MVSLTYPRVASWARWGTRFSHGFKEVAARLARPDMPWSPVLKGFAPDEANVNDYSKSEGSRLLMHWDDRGLYEEILCSVTVLGECVMTFRPSGSSNFRGREGSAEGPAVRMHIPARSLLVLRGAARDLASLHISPRLRVRMATRCAGASRLSQDLRWR